MPGRRTLDPGYLEQLEKKKSPFGNADKEDKRRRSQKQIQRFKGMRAEARSTSPGTLYRDALRCGGRSDQDNQAIIHAKKCWRKITMVWSSKRPCSWIFLCGPRPHPPKKGTRRIHCLVWGRKPPGTGKDLHCEIRGRAPGKKVCKGSALGGIHDEAAIARQCKKDVCSARLPGGSPMRCARQAWRTR